MSNSKLILFDGLCNLCNGFVQFVIKYDTQKQFTFGSLQSAKAQKLLQQYGITQNLITLILIDVDVVYY